MIWSTTPDPGRKVFIINSKTVGFIGLGKMGKGMALNFARKGYPLTVFDINQNAMQSVVEQGPARPSRNPSDLASKCDIIILSLPSPAEVITVILGADGIVESARKGLVIIDTSTIDPSTSVEIAETIRKKGITMLDAPLAGGGPRGAAIGKQMVIIGGPRDVFDEYSEILKVIGDRLVYAGENGKGLVLKLCFNIYNGMGLIAASEAFVFGDQQGIDPCLIYDVINSAKKGDWILENKCPYPNCNEQSPANRDYEPGFFLDHALKDYGFVISTINKLNTNYSMITLTHQMFTEASKAGFGRKDSSSIALYVKKLAGMK